MISQIQPDTKLPKMKFYRVYTALLRQSGTAAPIATVLQNTLGGQVIWRRENAGNYVAEMENISLEGRTTVQVGTYYQNGINAIQDDWAPNGVSLFTSRITDGVQTLTDNCLYETMIEIRIYE